MKSIIYSIFLISVSIANEAWASNTLVFNIESESDVKCSATLIKHNDSCRLVTNAHCIEDDQSHLTIKGEDLNHINSRSHSRDFIAYSTEEQKAIRLNYEKQFFGAISPSQLSLKKINRTMDLAELNLNPELEAKCAHLDNIHPNTSNNQSDQLSVIGYTTLKDREDPSPRVWYPHESQIKQDGLFIPETQFNKIEADLCGLDYMIELNELPMIWGQSGGAIVNTKGDLQCISTQFNPSQDKTYCIGVDQLIKFFTKEQNLSQCHSDKNTSENIGNGGKNGGNGGKNGGNGGKNGGNGGKNGGNGGKNGGNGGKNGGNGGKNGNSKVNCLSHEEYYEYFVEPDEGIQTLVNEIDAVVLNIGGNQIDGHDDFKAFHGTGEMIVRPIDENLDFSQRNKILERLSGEFEFNSTYKSSFVRNDSYLTNWQKLSNSELKSKVTISDNELTIVISEHTNSVLNELLPTRSVFTKRETTQRYQIEVSDDANQVLLKSPLRTLTCENKHYLKLICSGEDREFSISLDNTQKEGAHFRYSKKLDMLSVDYFYGEQNE